MIHETAERAVTAVLIGELLMYLPRGSICSKQVQLKAITQWQSMRRQR